MGQFPQQPQYIGAYPAPPHQRRWLGWFLFLALVVFLFILLSRKGQLHYALPLSEFMTRMEAGEVVSVALGDNELTGRLSTPQTTRGGQTTYHFRTDLPPGLSSDWSFVQWLLEHRGRAEVSVSRTSGLVTNILVPLIPWLLIFGFIWFFVFRQLRRASQAGQVPPGFSDPSRWVPDEPGKAGQA